MVVHYKFKSSREQQSVFFNGPHITCLDLRQEIIRESKIVKGRDFFELELSNAQTGEVYAMADLIGRNTSVLVRRVPVQRAAPIRSKFEGEASTPLSRDASMTEALTDGVVPTAAAGPSGATTSGPVFAPLNNAPPAPAPAPAPAQPQRSAYASKLICPLTGTVFQDAVIGAPKRVPRPLRLLPERAAALPAPSAHARAPPPRARPRARTAHPLLPLPRACSVVLRHLLLEGAA